MTTLNTRNKRRSALGWYPVHNELPAEADVRAGVVYADGTRTGVFVAQIIAIGEGVGVTVTDDVLAVSVND